MKRFLFLTALVLFSLTASQGQELRFGVKGGLNIASVGGEANFAVSSSIAARASFHIGALVEIPLMAKFSLQPELLYSSEGANWDWFLQSGKARIDYIRLPVLAKYHIIKGLSAEAGPSFGVLVAAKSDTRDIKDELQNFDLGIALGVSYRLDMGIFFSLRYNKGITNMNKKFVDEDGYNRNEKNQTNVFQMSAGYSF